MLRSLLDLIRKSYTLVRPYGLNRLSVVFFFILGQGLLQVVGVTSIFPFLSLAADPEGMRESGVGRWLTENFPDLTNQQLLISAGIAVVVAILLSSLMNLLSEVVRTMYVARFSHWLRMRLLWRYLARPYGFFLQNHSGIMLKKVSGDVNGFTSSVLLALLDSISRALTSLLLFATLFIVSWKIALVATLGISIYYVVIFSFLRERRRLLSEGMKAANRGGWVALQHLFGGIKPVLVHGVQGAFAETYREHSDRLTRLSPRVPIYSNSPRYFIEPLLFGGMVVFVIILMVQGKSIESVLPQLGVLGLAGYRLLPAAQMLYGQLSSMEGMRHTLDEVYDEFLEVEKLKSQQTKNAGSGTQDSLPLKRELCLEKVSFGYVGSAKAAVHDVSLCIPRGASVAFVGPSGSGKSTLVDIIIGLHRLRSGKIRVDDQYLIDELVPAWRAALGYVPQDIFLLDASLTENIAFGIPKDQVEMERVREVAERAQILHFIETQLPEGFETRVGERGVRLSGGQRQRIGLARALYHQPQILILDEATSALDSRTETAFMNAVESLREEMTVIMIAHRLSTVKNCDTIYFLEGGVIIASGSFDQLVESCPAFAQLARSVTEPSPAA